MRASEPNRYFNWARDCLGRKRARLPQRRVHKAATLFIRLYHKEMNTSGGQESCACGRSRVRSFSLVQCKFFAETCNLQTVLRVGDRMVKQFLQVASRVSLDHRRRGTLKGTGGRIAA